MYVPRFNALDDDEAIRAMVLTIGSAELITVGEDGYPLSTRLPVVWDGDRLVLHIARANPHWRSIPSDRDVPALAVVTDAEAYVSPAWYATKAEHGRVVPTWNEAAVHFSGRVQRHDDPDWVRSAVTLLTEQQESSRAEPWAVTDVPATYIDKQLRAIVGLEVTIEGGRGQGQAESEPVRRGPGRRRSRVADRGQRPRGDRRRPDGAAAVTATAPAGS